MKKVLLVSLVLGLIIILSPFTTRAQDDTEMAWASHLKKAINNRPHPEIFSEKEAWKVLTGEITCSQNFIEKRLEYKNFYFFVKNFTSIENYSRSSTSSVDGWWYHNLVNYKESEWELNIRLIIPFVVSFIFLLFSFFGVKKYYYKRKIKLEGSPEMETPLMKISFIFFGLMFIFLIYSIFILDNEISGLIFIPILISLFAYLTIKSKINKLEINYK